MSCLAYEETPIFSFKVPDFLIGTATDVWTASRRCFWSRFSSVLLSNDWRSSFIFPTFTKKYLPPVYKLYMLTVYAVYDMLHIVCITCSARRLSRWCWSFWYSLRMSALGWHAEILFFSHLSPLIIPLPMFLYGPYSIIYNIFINSKFENSYQFCEIAWNSLRRFKFFIVFVRMFFTHFKSFYIHIVLWVITEK